MSKFETLKVEDLRTLDYGAILWNVNDGSLVRLMDKVSSKLPENLEELDLESKAGQVATIFSADPKTAEKDVTYKEIVENYNHLGTLFGTLEPNVLAAVGFLMTDVTSIKMMLQGAANQSSPSKYKVSEGGIITD